MGEYVLVCRVQQRTRDGGNVLSDGDVMYISWTHGTTCWQLPRPQVTPTGSPQIDAGRGAGTSV
jgi:hypothetical protein